MHRLIVPALSVIAAACANGPDPVLASHYVLLERDGRPYPFVDHVLRYSESSRAELLILGQVIEFGPRDSVRLIEGRRRILISSAEADTSSHTVCWYADGTFRRKGALVMVQWNGGRDIDTLRFEGTLLQRVLRDAAGRRALQRFRASSSPVFECPERRPPEGVPNRS